VLAGLQLRRDGDNLCSIRLEPMQAGQDLSLERWSLAACAPAVEEAMGVRLSVEER
jgi:hypothetical protein